MVVILRSLSNTLDAQNQTVFVEIMTLMIETRSYGTKIHAKRIFELNASIKWQTLQLLWNC